MKTEVDLIAEIADAEEQIRNAKAALAELATIPEDERVADSLHDLLCTWNHTDGCGWYYEFNSNKKPDWNGYAHNYYLTKARLLIGKCKEHGISASNAVSMFKLVKS